MKRNIDRLTGRRLLLAAAYGLTSSLLGATAHAGKCESGKAIDHADGQKVQSTIRFIGYRYVPASSGATRTSDRVMLPSSRSASITTPAPDALFRGNAPKLPTNARSKETAL